MWDCSTAFFKFMISWWIASVFSDVCRFAFEFLLLLTRSAELAIFNASFEGSPVLRVLGVGKATFTAVQNALGDFEVLTLCSTPGYCTGFKFFLSKLVALGIGLLLYWLHFRQYANLWSVWVVAWLCIMDSVDVSLFLLLCSSGIFGLKSVLECFFRTIANLVLLRLIGYLPLGFFSFVSAWDRWKNVNFISIFWTA